ncbi:unnamed protein product [Amoebophrya sp. A25]|nr:unnamed protein product [Amoebophrya sp. A25]|eukprot:GSA25T00014279001.1
MPIVAASCGHEPDFHTRPISINMYIYVSGHNFHFSFFKSFFIKCASISIVLHSTQSTKTIVIKRRVRLDIIQVRILDVPAKLTFLTSMIPFRIPKPPDRSHVNESWT